MQTKRNDTAAAHSSHQSRFWWLLTGAWTILSLFMANQLVVATKGTSDPIGWYNAIPFEFVYCLQWVALARVTLWLANVFPLRSRKFIIGFFVHIVAGIFFSSLTMGGRVIISWVIVHHVQTPLTFDLIFSRMSDAFDYGIMSYLLNMLFCYSYVFYTQARDREVKALQLESELSRAELTALKMQLHPHFFFNTLNAISVLIRKGENDLAVDMIARLSKFLRYTLDKTATQEVSLREELDAIDLYLEIQKVRFQDTLILKRMISPESLDTLVPTLILQPLVENAFQHGISKRENGGTLELSAERLNGSIHIKISDDGPGFAGMEVTHPRHGVGLTNTISRLQKLYGTGYVFEMIPKQAGGTTVHLTLPYRPETE